MSYGGIPSDVNVNVLVIVFIHHAMFCRLHNYTPGHWARHMTLISQSQAPLSLLHNSHYCCHIGADTAYRSNNASTSLPGTIFLLLWFEEADQTTPITCYRGQCVTRDMPQPPHHVAHPARGSLPGPFAQHSTEATAVTITPWRPQIY